MVRAGQTVSQIALHMGVAFGVMYVMTGSVAYGGIAALIEPVCNVALLPLHDRLWEKIRTRAQARQRKRVHHSGSIFAPLTISA
jgi:uncharacterized membrane protein